MISRNYSEKISFITFFRFFTNAPGLTRLSHEVVLEKHRYTLSTRHTWPLTKFEGGLNLLHEADDAVIRLESTVTAALTK